jgi:hypothetical protein
MIKVRALDANGDFTGGRGRNDYLTGSNAIAQNIRTRLSSYLGDCYFNIREGIDWFGFLGSKNQAGLRQAIETTITNTEGVTEVLRLSLSLDSGRRFSLSYEVNTIYTGVLGPTATIVGTINYLITEGGSVITTEDGNPITV